MAYSILRSLSSPWFAVVGWNSWLNKRNVERSGQIRRQQRGAQKDSGSGACCWSIRTRPTCHKLSSAPIRYESLPGKKITKVYESQWKHIFLLLFEAPGWNPRAPAEEVKKKLFNTLELNYHFIFQRASVPKFMMIVCWWNSLINNV